MVFVPVFCRPLPGEAELPRGRGLVVRARSWIRMSVKTSAGECPRETAPISCFTFCTRLLRWRDSRGAWTLIAIIVYRSASNLSW